VLALRLFFSSYIFRLRQSVFVSVTLCTVANGAS